MFKSLIYSISAWIIPSIILITLVFSVVKKIPVYETFIDGAKDGLKVTVGIIPYLIAIITAVSMLRASGAIDLAARAFSGCLDYFKIPVDVVPIMVGSSETTFYVLSVYFGAVGVKKFRHSLCAGVFADIIGIIAAVLVARWLFL